MLVVSYTTVSPLPAGVATDIGGLFSVALSVGSRRLGVTQHPALWSPDFPPSGFRNETDGNHPAGSLSEEYNESGRDVLPDSAATCDSAAETPENC